MADILIKTLIFLKNLLTFQYKVGIIASVDQKNHIFGPLAQLVEHLTLNQGVPGSSP